MAVREYIMDDLNQIRKILRDNFRLDNKIIESQIRGINLTDKIWIQEAPDFKGFVWAKLRGDKMFVKYIFLEKNLQLFSEMMFFVEEYARTNGMSTIFVSVSPAMQHLETMFLERSYEYTEDPILGKMYYINV